MTGNPNLQITYPSDGGTKSVSAGVTTFNFVSGVVTLPTGAQEQMSTSLHENDDTHCRSLLINSDDAVSIRLDDEGAFSPDAGAYLHISHKEFRIVRVTTTSSATRLSIQAFTNPEVGAHMSSVVTDLEPTPFAYESITVAATAIGCTSSTYSDATKAEMTLETAQIRIRIDGTAPTASEGHIVEISDIVTLTSASQISQFKATRTGGTSGVLRISYFH